MVVRSSLETTSNTPVEQQHVSDGLHLPSGANVPDNF